MTPQRHAFRTTATFIVIRFLNSHKCPLTDVVLIISKTYDIRTYISSRNTPLGQSGQNRCKYSISHYANSIIWVATARRPPCIPRGIRRTSRRHRLGWTISCIGIISAGACAVARHPVDTMSLPPHLRRRRCQCHVI